MREKPPGPETKSECVRARAATAATAAAAATDIFKKVEKMVCGPQQQQQQQQQRNSLSLSTFLTHALRGKERRGT